MNSYKKSAEEIMKRGDRLIAEKRRKEAIIMRTAFSAAGLCAAAVIGIGIWNSRDIRDAASPDISDRFSVVEVTAPPVTALPPVTTAVQTTSPVRTTRATTSPQPAETTVSPEILANIATRPAAVPVYTPPVTTTAAKTPHVYVDLVDISETRVRADIMLENVTTTTSGGFHVSIPEGLEPVTTNEGVLELSGSCRPSGGVTQLVTVPVTGTKDYYMAFISINSAVSGKKLCSIYLDKTDNYSGEQAEISVCFAETDRGSDCTAISGDETALMSAEPDTEEKISDEKISD